MHTHPLAHFNSVIIPLIINKTMHQIASIPSTNWQYKRICIKTEAKN